VNNPGVIVILKSLSVKFWLLFTMVGSLWSIIYVIMVYLTDFLTEKWNMDEEFEAGTNLDIFFCSFGFGFGFGYAFGYRFWSFGSGFSLGFGFVFGFGFFFSVCLISIAGLYSSIVFFIGVPFSVGTGWFISKYGNSISLIIVAGAIFGWSCLILGLTNFHPIFGIVGIGLATGKDGDFVEMIRDLFFLS
jgi:hypothetical protein